MRLTDDVYLVGGGNLGFNLSGDADCHIYVLRSGRHLALIDAGLGLSTDMVLENIRSDGLDPSAIGDIFVTHYHADHAGGLRQWRDLTGARVHASRVSARAIRDADSETVGLTAAQRSGSYPADYRLQPCPVDVEFDDAPESFQVGALAMVPQNSPGHCDGHTAYLVKGTDRGYLFSGDCVLWGGTIILQNIPDCRIAEYAASLERLATLPFDALLPGHLAISLRNGKRHVDAAASTFRSMGIPRNAV